MTGRPAESVAFLRIQRSLEHEYTRIRTRVLVSNGYRCSRTFCSREALSAQDLASRGTSIGNSRVVPRALPLSPAFVSPAAQRARQELLATLLQPEAAIAASNLKDGGSAKVSASSPPTAGQARGVVGPLEQALKIYTDLKNASQAAACHYQVTTSVPCACIDNKIVVVCVESVQAVRRNFIPSSLSFFFEQEAAVLVDDRRKEGSLHAMAVSLPRGLAACNIFWCLLLIPPSPAQIGQYYSKVIPAYIGSHLASESAGASSSDVGTTARASSSGTNTITDSFTTFKDSGSSALQVAKAWECGHRAARHFLAARAYFAPFEHGPTSVILALDLCNLYLFLADMGATATGGGGSGGRAVDPISSSISSADSRDGVDSSVVPIPSRPGTTGEGATVMALSGRSGLTTTGRAGGGGAEGGADHRLRPTAAVRFRCLEGALRALLDTQSVFAEAEIDLTATPAAAAAGQPQHRLRRLLESVMERLPKVLQALVRASVALETSSPSSLPLSTSIKSLYKTSLMALRGGGEGGAQGVLARLAKEYEAVGRYEAVNDKYSL